MSHTSLDIIEEEIAATRKKIEESEAEIVVRQHQIQESSQTLAILVHLREKIESASQTVVATTRPTDSLAKRLGATEAVLSLLRREKTVPRKKIIDALENRVTTRAKNKRSLLRQTLINLEKNGKIRRVRDKYSLANSGNI